MVYKWHPLMLWTLFRARLWTYNGDEDGTLLPRPVLEFVLEEHAEGTGHLPTIFSSPEFQKEMAANLSSPKQRPSRVTMVRFASSRCELVTGNRITLNCCCFLIASTVLIVELSSSGEGSSRENSSGEGERCIGPTLPLLPCSPRDAKVGQCVDAGQGLPLPPTAPRLGTVKTGDT